MLGFYSAPFTFNVSGSSVGSAPRNSDYRDRDGLGGTEASAAAAAAAAPGRPGLGPAGGPATVPRKFHQVRVQGLPAIRNSSSVPSRVSQQSVNMVDCCRRGHSRGSCRDHSGSRALFWLKQFHSESLQKDCYDVIEHNHNVIPFNLFL